MPTYDIRTDKDGKKKVRARIRVAPFPLEALTFDRKEDARAWAEPREAELRRMKQLGLADEELLASTLTLKFVIDEVIARNVYGARKDYQTVHFHFLWWKENLGGKKLLHITPGIIDDAVDILKTEPCACKDINGNPIKRWTKNADGTPRLRSPRTIETYLASLTLIFKYAIKKRWVAYNPVRDAEKPTVDNQIGRHLSPDKYHFPGDARPKTWDELNDREKEIAPADAYELPRFLEACMRQDEYYAYHPEWLYNLVILRLSSGVRPNEALTLTWSQIDLIEGKFILHDTKNGKSYPVALEGEALDILKQMHKNRRMDTDYVFPREDGKAPLRMRHRYLRAFKDANLKNFRIHDLRHTAGSYHAMLGKSSKEVAEALNQKSARSAERYMHLSKPHTRENVRAMTKAFISPKARGVDAEQERLNVAIANVLTMNTKADPASDDLAQRQLQEAIAVVLRSAHQGLERRANDNGEPSGVNDEESVAQAARADVNR